MLGFLLVSLVVVAGLESWRRSVAPYLSRTERGVCLLAELAVLVGPQLYRLLVARAFEDVATRSGGDKAIAGTVRRRRSTLAEARVVTKD